MNEETIKNNCRAFLLQAVSLCRPAGSTTEAEYVAKLARFGPTMIDQAGNLHFDRRGEHSKTLFCAHTDTVHNHRCEGNNPNKVEIDGRTEWVKADGDVLGADDGAGIAVVLSMMLANVPGYYVLFREEECGGRGSEMFADWLRAGKLEFDRAVAFDRAGYGDVITHQAVGRCCSDAFAEALASALNDADADFMYSPCDRGSFTDTANLVDLIPECTNLSVGYFRQHTTNESQNITHLLALTLACCKLDWESLPVKRDPDVIDIGSRWGGFLGRGQHTLETYGDAEQELEDALTDLIDGDTSTIENLLVAEGLIDKDEDIDWRHFDEDFCFVLIDDIWRDGIDAAKNEIIRVIEKPKIAKVMKKAKEAAEAAAKEKA